MRNNEKKGILLTLLGHSCRVPSPRPFQRGFISTTYIMPISFHTRLCARPPTLRATSVYPVPPNLILDLNAIVSQWTGVSVTPKYSPLDGSPVQIQGGVYVIRSTSMWPFERCKVQRSNYFFCRPEVDECTRFYEGIDEM